MLDMTKRANDKKLFLDDVRRVKDVCSYVPNPGVYCDEEWEIVKSYDEFIHFIMSTGIPKTISFDHDLADEHYQDLLSDENFSKDDSDIELKYNDYKEKTGLECAKWLVRYCSDNNHTLPECFVHSANPIGKKNIEAYLSNAKKHLNL